MSEKLGQNQETYIRPPVTPEESKEHLKEAIEYVKNIIKELRGVPIGIGKDYIEYDDQIRFGYHPREEYDDSSWGKLKDKAFWNKLMVNVFLGGGGHGGVQMIASSEHHRTNEEDHFGVGFMGHLEVTDDDFHIFIGEVELLLEQSYKDRGVLKPQDRKLSKEEIDEILDTWYTDDWYARNL
jgi:hypothetical protein